VECPLVILKGTPPGDRYSRTQEEQIIKPVVLSVDKEYAASYVPKAVMLDLPEPLTNLYDKQTRDLNLAELQDRAEALFEETTVTKEQVQKMSLLECVCVCVREREAYSMILFIQDIIQTAKCLAYFLFV